MTMTMFVLKFKTSLRHIRDTCTNKIIILAKINNKMEVHQASINVYFL